MQVQTTKRDFYAEVTARIIESLEKGVVPWHQPWGFMEPAQNHFSGHRYRGVNALLLLMGNFKTPYFGTINQINEAGGRVKKGSKSVPVYFHDRIYKDKSGAKLPPEVGAARVKAGDKSVSVYPFIRLFPVFNMADVEGCPVKPSCEILNENNEPLPVCADFVAALSSTVNITSENNPDALYNATKDLIVMPEIRQFISAEFYYMVLFHELTHWTGHESRLNRPTLKDALKFGDTNYSKEELIAELGACFLSNQFGIATPQIEANSTSYIDHWLGVLKKDKRFIWEVASDAQAAFTYLNELAA